MISKLYIKITVPWWIINIYLPCLIVFTKFCRLFNPEATPDKEKLSRFLMSHIKISGVKHG